MRRRTARDREQIVSRTTRGNGRCHHSQRPPPPAWLPLALLGQIIDAYHPDLILVEIRPTAFAAKHYEDGPMEMTYVVDRAEHAHVAVEPIDWWTDEDMGAEPTVSDDDRRALDEAVRTLPEPVWPAFEVANSPEERSRTLRSLNAEARYEGGNPVWARRQAWFNAQALAAIERHHARRALAFVGYSHRAEIEGYLAGTGLHLDEPTALRLTPVDGDAPAGVVQLWREGTERLRASAAALSGVQRSRIDAKVRYFSIAVERKGRCCVTEAALSAEAP